MTGVLAVLAVLVAATAFGLWWRRADGRLRHARGASRGDDNPAELAAGPTLTAEDLRAGLGERATLVHFSTAFCQPCRATRQILGRVADDVDGVVHVEIDAEQRLDLVRRLDVVRTPTVLVLDATGRPVRRGTGTPRYADVVAAVADAVL